MVQYERDHLSPTLTILAAIELKEAMELGFEEGFKQGKAEEKKNLTLTLLGEGFDTDYVAKLMKLSVPEVEKLKKTLQ